MSRNLLKRPLCEAEDLGRAIPDSAHAVSVCLPTWQDVVDYEEKESRVLNAMEAGYPRFFLMPQVAHIQARLLEERGESGEECLLFPTRGGAERCRTFSGGEGRLMEVDGLTAYFFPSHVQDRVGQYRRHSGDIPSSRQAEAFLDGRPTSSDAGVEQDSGQESGQWLSGWTGQPGDHHLLYRNGMNACFHLHRALVRAFAGEVCVQFGFPYVDVLKVQEKFSPGSVFVRNSGASGLAELEGVLASRKVTAVFTEVPTNPLLGTPDLEAVSGLCREWEVPLVVDDTIGGWWNTDVLRWADVSWSSLTKLFSGVSDVMAGVVVVNKDSRFVGRILEALEKIGEAGMFAEDLRVLRQNAEDYPERVRTTNANARSVVEFLRDHPKVRHVYYPEFEAREAYDRVRRPEGGFGCLFSMVLNEPEKVTPLFYDSLRVSKGPSLGTNFTLACPFTLLAHYHELEWAESCGVSRWLVRVSVGLEDPDELIGRFQDALPE